MHPACDTTYWRFCYAPTDVGTPHIVPTPVRRRNPLHLIRIYTIAMKPTILSKITMQLYLHVRMHQIVHTKVRRRNLLRPIRAYTIRGKPSISTNLSSCWAAANNVCTDQTPQLAGLIGIYTPRREPTILCKTAIQCYLHVRTQRTCWPNWGLHPSQETYNSVQNSYPMLSSRWDAANNVYPDQTPQLAGLIGVYTLAGTLQFCAKQLSNVIFMLGRSE